MKTKFALIYYMLINYHLGGEILVAGFTFLHPIETWSHMDDVFKRLCNDFGSQWNKYNLVHGMAWWPCIETVNSFTTWHAMYEN